MLPLKSLKDFKKFLIFLLIYLIYKTYLNVISNYPPKACRLLGVSETVGRLPGLLPWWLSVLQVRQYYGPI